MQRDFVTVDAITDRSLYSVDYFPSVLCQSWGQLDEQQQHPLVYEQLLVKLR
jgi:hypothetical protein